MKTLIGGAIAAALGLVGLVIWWGQFLMALTGIIPAMLLLGGALAIYLGFDELKDTWKDDETVESPPESSEGEEVEKYKKETDDLKEEIETLKKETLKKN
jgi:cell division protein FtsB